MLSAIFFSFTKKPLAASNMSVLSIPLLCSILGEPLIVTQTFVRSEYEEDGFPLTHSPTVNNVHVWNFFWRVWICCFRKICKACWVHCSVDHCAGVQFLVSHKAWSFLATAMRQSGLRKWMEFSCWACWISSHSWLLYQDDSYCRLLLFCCGNFKVYYLPSSSQRKTRFPLQFFFSNFCGK